MVTVEVGLDTAPGDSPRSYEYNNEGMDFEGWKLTAGPLFGITLFQKEVDTIEEAENLKAEALAICKELYSGHSIRGAKVGILKEVVQ